MGRLRRDYLDHVLVLGVLQLIRIQKECIAYIHRARPQPGLPTQRTAGLPPRPFLAKTADR